MTVDLRRDVVRIGLQVAGILNLVADDDERDALHGLLERTVNDELFAGSQLRAPAAVADLPTVRRMAAAPVVDIFSRKVR